MMRRFLTAVLLLWALPAFGQGTPMPIPLAQWFDNAGAVLDEGGLCVFVAGSSSTLATTYTTAALSVANANPIEFDSAGRPSSGGVFLTPGTSYRFILKDFSGVVTPTCVPDTGSTIWTVDHVEAVPGSSAAVDVTGTAGESIAAGDAVFLSNGACALTTGQWYRTDADTLCRSTDAAMVGMAPSAIASAASGSIRIVGAVTTSGLSAGSPYYAGASAGALVATPPTNAIRMGQAQSATVFIVGYTEAPVGPRGPPCGRLTLTSGTPVTVADVTAAGTLYYAPYGGCTTVPTFDGVNWQHSNFAELSIAVPAVATQLYDVFIYDNAGTLALELTAWTNDTTRATALTTQNGVYVKTGALTRLYLGSVRTVTASQLNDSFALRHVWNYYHRQVRLSRVAPTADNWSWTTDTYQQWAASAANQLDFVIGVAEVAIHAECRGFASNAGAVNVAVSMGVNGITASTVAVWRWQLTVAGVATPVSAALDYYPAVGRNYVTALERSEAAGVTTWLGDNGGATQVQAAIWGWVEG